MQYRLDSTKAQKLQISDDAFHYLMYGEDPLDEDNLDEANEVSALFPYGFSISDWEVVEGEYDLIEVTFIPYVADDVKYDGQMDYIAKGWVFKYRTISQKAVHIRIENEINGKIRADFDCNIVTIHNNPWVVFNADGDASALSSYSNCSIIPLLRCKRI